MARRSHHAMAPAAFEDAPDAMTPHALTKQEFGRRLSRIIGERHMSQADLARAVEDKTGVKLGRDAISTYINGKVFPTPKSLGLLCDTLGLDRDELLPNATISAINDEHPALELRAAAGHPGMAWVRINRMMRFETATQIITLINKEDQQDFDKK